MDIVTNLFEKLLQLTQQFRRVLLYGIIGLSALGLELIIFFALSNQWGISIWLGNACGMLAGLVFAFVLNAHYNFQVEDRKLERFLRYGLVAFGGYILTSGIIFVLTNHVHTTVIIAKFISLPPYFLFQYNCHRLFTFHQAENPLPLAQEQTKYNSLTE